MKNGMGLRLSTDFPTAEKKRDIFLRLVVYLSVPTLRVVGSLAAAAALVSFRSRLQ